MRSGHVESRNVSRFDHDVLITIVDLSTKVRVAAPVVSGIDVRVTHVSYSGVQLPDARSYNAIYLSFNTRYLGKFCVYI